MSDYEKTGNITVAALKADVHPQTARKYIQAATPPDQLQKPHTWRTRTDPLERIWPEVEGMLAEAPELEAKMLFEHFLARPDSGLEECHLRTFFRRVRRWRATAGPEREVFFAQDRQPGQLMQLDWTHARELEVTIQGEPLDHFLCQCVLPYSNWQWATRCISESFLSLVGGLQAALRELGGSPECLGTDNSSTATHELESIPGRGRGFNSDYLELCTHYDLKWTPELRPVAKLDFSRSAQHEKEQIDEEKTQTVQWRLQGQSRAGGDDRNQDDGADRA